jgi:hypothetical protein
MAPLNYNMIITVWYDKLLDRRRMFACCVFRFFEEWVELINSCFCFVVVPLEPVVAGRGF